MMVRITSIPSPRRPVCYAIRCNDDAGAFPTTANCSYGGWDLGLIPGSAPPPSIEVVQPRPVGGGGALGVLRCYV